MELSHAELVEWIAYKELEAETPEERARAASNDIELQADAIMAALMGPG